MNNDNHNEQEIDLFLKVSDLLDEHGTRDVLVEAATHFAMIQDDEDRCAHCKLAAQFMERELTHLIERYEHFFRLLVANKQANDRANQSAS